ncbi:MULTISPECIES: purine-nucleoside phosphorylase [unclassified Mesotoga]|jgi:purine-nucleoside phosphorylase|uniref:purine-nucleoside phosphorylase n=1 Tax=unclassified Mesotoga TaxID=1184398 RepID=UPI0025E38F84|nr:MULTISPECIES: purine-nucleoside phosphorylase [unclassified Mesotoga]MDD3460081.1 purine-nucleoside phosphorylase [Mesotoga sp.]
MSISVLQEELREYVENVKRAARFIEKEVELKPKVAVILGSGLGDVSNSLENAVSIPYDEIPGFPLSTAPGHKGELTFGNALHHNVMLMNGRFHFYEGYSMKTVTFPIRIMQELGVEVLLITNASGGLNPDFEVGRVMLIKDIINFMGDNPLIGQNVDEWGPRFPDMSEPIDKDLLEKALISAKELGIGVYEGVYVGVAGPNFETPAELRMLRRFGADSVGMSTVPEVIVARHAGIRVLGLSAISDRAVPDDLKPLTAEEVLEMAKRAGNDISKLILKTLEKI